MVGRKAGVVDELDNTEVLVFINESLMSTVDFYGLPCWVIDCISGSCNQITGTQKYSPPRLWRLLIGLNIISTKTVAEALNRKRVYVQGKEPYTYSSSYVKQVTSALRCANRALMYHKKRYYEEKCRVKENHIDRSAFDSVLFNEEELIMIREASKISSDHYKKTVKDIIEIKKLIKEIEEN